MAEEIRLGSGEKLFDFLAECIADFVMKTLGKDYPPMPLGFTFSFPMEQSGLNKGVLVSWTKSFNASGVVGQDAVKVGLDTDSFTPERRTRADFYKFYMSEVSKTWLYYHL